MSLSFGRGDGEEAAGGGGSRLGRGGEGLGLMEAGGAEDRQQGPSKDGEEIKQVDRHSSHRPLSGQDNDLGFYFKCQRKSMEGLGTDITFLN